MVGACDMSVRPNRHKPR